MTKPATSTNTRTAAEGGVMPARSPFAVLGRFTVRFRYLILVAWLVAVVLAVRLLPSLSSVSNNNNSAFLPSHEPSMQAAQLAAPFEHGTLPTALLVAARGSGTLTAGSPDSTAAMQAIPTARQAVARVATLTGASAGGVAGQAALSQRHRGRGPGGVLPTPPAAP